MAGKTASKLKIKKDEPKIDMAYFDDIILRLDAAEDNIEGAIKSIDMLGIRELTMRVEKVEARLGIG